MHSKRLTTNREDPLYMVTSLSVSRFLHWHGSCIDAVISLTRLLRWRGYCVEARLWHCTVIGNTAIAFAWLLRCVVIETRSLRWGTVICQQIVIYNIVCVSRFSFIILQPDVVTWKQSSARSWLLRRSKTKNTISRRAKISLSGSAGTASLTYKIR